MMSCCRWLQCWCRCPSWCQGSCYCRCYVLVTMPVFMFVSMSELQTQPWQRKGRKGWGGRGGGGGERRATELCGWLNSTVERWSDCLLRDESVLSQVLESQVSVAMVQYGMSADYDGEVTRGVLPCLVPELSRVVKRVVPGPSMIRHQIVKTHDLVETRSTPSWRPFGCCLPTRANHVICLNVGSSFLNHEVWSRSTTSSWVHVFI